MRREDVTVMRTATIWGGGGEMNGWFIRIRHGCDKRLYEKAETDDGACQLKRTLELGLALRGCGKRGGGLPIGERRWLGRQAVRSELRRRDRRRGMRWLVAAGDGGLRAESWGRSRGDAAVDLRGGPGAVEKSVQTLRLRSHRLLRSLARRVWWI